ncbi:MAG TPA: hypothetical protein VFQ68_18880 [Streptosporangiaceae bacterium]|nr:hypothetical protein [Streptosporangiaceae bacterium]
MPTGLLNGEAQSYFDGNKRTARYMMNGHLMSHGFDAISVPAARRHEFNAGMAEFFTTKDGTGMFRFLVSCRAEADRGVLPGDNDRMRTFAVACAPPGVEASAVAPRATLCSRERSAPEGRLLP